MNIRVDIDINSPLSIAKKVADVAGMFKIKNKVMLNKEFLFTEKATKLKADLMTNIRI